MRRSRFLGIGPSKEFSTGTTARSASPSSRAEKGDSRVDPQGMRREEIEVDADEKDRVAAS